jgi:AcrR family transcriptional regulator
MARGRSPGYDDQRDAILANAAALFAQQGYVGTSMNQVASACGISKAALYHYFRDKYALLVNIAEVHIDRLEALVGEVRALELPPERRLREYVHRFVGEYARARDSHRVLTEDVRFLEPADRERILDGERRVVAAVAGAIAELRPQMDEAGLAKPVAMLMFGMINWMFTWLKTDGPLTYEDMAPVAADLLLNGLGGLTVPATATPRVSTEGIGA